MSRPPTASAGRSRYLSRCTGVALSTKNTASRDIALAFGVPPQLLGIPGDNTYSNYQEARLALWEETVVPLLRHLRDELNAWLVPKFGDDLELDIDLDEIPALILRRKEKWDMALAAVDRGVISRNEARLALGLGEREGADDLLVPLGVVPIDFDPENDNPPAKGGTIPEEARKKFHVAYGGEPSDEDE